MQVEEFMRLKKENHINSLGDLRKWMDYINVHSEGNNTAEGFVMWFLDEMPVNRESLEEIWEAAMENDYMYYP